MTELPFHPLDLGTGEPLVFIPGVAGRRGVPEWLGNWLRGQEILGLSRFRSVRSIDRRVGLEVGITISELATEYAHQIDDLYEEPVDVVAISTGGVIALQMAVDFPGLIRRLVLVSAAYRLSEHGEELQRDIASALRNGHARRAAGMFLANTGSTSARRALLGVAGRLLPRSVVGRNDSDLLATLDAEDGFDLADRLGEIRIPTFVTGGGNDRFYSAALIADTAARIPGAKLSIYARAGHIGTQGNRRLVRDIRAFLESD